MHSSIIQTAEKLKEPSVEAQEAFSRKLETLVAKGNEVMVSRPDLAKLIGEDNREMAENNNHNFARFMESIFLVYDPNTLVETVLWVFRAYRSHGFKTTYWAANLDIWVTLLKEELNPEYFDEIVPFYKWLIVNIPKFARLTDQECEEIIACGTPHG